MEANEVINMTHTSIAKFQRIASTQALEQYMVKYSYIISH